MAFVKGSLLSRLLLLCVGVIIVDASLGKVSEELKVTLPHGGALVGKYMTSHRGRGIRAFLGIPFAEPPVGELRFQPPYPKLPWTDVLVATNGDRSCPQPFGASIIGEEDCLYVNVYAPLNPRSKGPLPVMMFIHGGGFTSGSGGVSFYPPGFLLDHDVVFVAGNYRLGALGFLSLGRAELPGNMGLKDQHLLLQWVQDNIASFGGDPRQVTIFGESAGGASVGYHLISKVSHSLFQKAILQSGTQYAPWAFDKLGENAKHTEQLGDGVGCALGNASDDVERFVYCLKQKSAKELVEKEVELFQLDMTFHPNVEASLEGFIQKAPNQYTRSIGLDIPVLIGITSEEGAMMFSFFSDTDSDNTWAKMKSVINTEIIKYSNHQASEAKTKEEVSKLIKEFYFKNDSIDNANRKNVTDFFSDGYFGAAMDEFLVNRLVTNTNAADTFVYLFSHRGAVSLPDLMPALGFPAVTSDEDFGVSHADDLVYLFPMGENLVSHKVPTKVDELIHSVVTEMWVNFATNGQPSSSTTTQDNVTWRAAHGYPLDFLRIGNYGQPSKSLLGMESGLFEERVNLWRQVKSINDKEEAPHGAG